MAPELFSREDSYDEKSDAYSFGVLLLELILSTEFRQFGTDDRFEIANGRPPTNCAEEMKMQWERRTKEHKFLYTLAQQCLVTQADRPSFSEIVQRLKANVEERAAVIFTKNDRWTVPETKSGQVRAFVLCVGGGGHGSHLTGASSGWVETGMFDLQCGSTVEITIGQGAKQSGARGGETSFTADKKSSLVAAGGDAAKGGSGGGHCADGGAEARDGQGKNPGKGQITFPSLESFTQAKLRPGEGGKGCNLGGGGGGGVVIESAQLKGAQRVSSACFGTDKSGQRAGLAGEGFGAGGGSGAGKCGRGDDGVVYIEYCLR